MIYTTALKILGGFTLKPGDDWDRHCIGVGDIVYRLALEIKKHLEIDAEKARVMGLVHDFGRCVSHDPYRHACEGHKLMKSLGYDEYARICTSHTNGTYKDELLEEYGLKPEDFFVRNLSEKLVFIGDSIESRGRIIRHNTRIAQTIERYRHTSPEFIPVLESKLEEFKAFDKDIKEIIGMGTYEYFGI